MKSLLLLLERRGRQNHDIGKRRNRTGCPGEKNRADRYGYRSAEPGCGHGSGNRIVYNLVDVVEGNCRMKQALIRDKRYPNLYLLPSAQTRDKTAVSPEQMKKLVDDLRDEFDYILLDCPAGIERGFQNAIAGADRALVVTTPEVSAIRDADRIDSGFWRPTRLAPLI